MDPEDRKLLLESIQLSRENHSMLKKMRRAQKNGRMFKAIYWVVIIGLTYAAYAYVKPYLEQARAAYEATQSQIQDIKDFGNSIKMP
jgi:hypothetical protein